jgi:hypothetical protein
VEAGRGEQVAPGVTRQRLVNAEPRWAADAAGAAENLSQGQLRPSLLRGPGPRAPPAPAPPEGGAAGAPVLATSFFSLCRRPPHADDVLLEKHAVRLSHLWRAVFAQHVRLHSPRVTWASSLGPAGMNIVPCTGGAGAAGAGARSGTEADEPARVLHRVPAHAAWFRYDRIHNTERLGVPEFFSGERPTHSLRARASCLMFLEGRVRATFIHHDRSTEPCA